MPIGLMDRRCDKGRRLSLNVGQAQSVILDDFKGDLCSAVDILFLRMMIMIKLKVEDMNVSNK